MKIVKIDSIGLRLKSIPRYATWVLVVFLLISITKNIGRVMSIRRQVEEERVRVEKMEAENERVRAQIAEAQGADFIEKQIRDKLGLTKEGEAIVVLPDEAVLKSFAPARETDENALPDPNWMKWRNLFF
jgi:cell division protein FtsB